MLSTERRSTAAVQFILNYVLHCKSTKKGNRLSAKPFQIFLSGGNQIYTSFMCYLVVLLSTLGNCRGRSLTNPMLITTFLLFTLTQRSLEAHSEVGFQSLAKHLVGGLNQESSNFQCSALTH